MIWCWCRSLWHGFLLFSALLPPGQVEDWEDLSLRKGAVAPSEGNGRQVVVGHL